MKISVFELNIRLVFHRTPSVDVQSILEFLQLIHDRMSSENAIRLFVGKFPAV